MLELAALEAGILSALHIIHNSSVGAVGLQTLEPIPPSYLFSLGSSHRYKPFSSSSSVLQTDIFTLVFILTVTCVSMLHIPHESDHILTHSHTHSLYFYLIL